MPGNGIRMLHCRFARRMGVIIPSHPIIPSKWLEAFCFVFASRIVFLKTTLFLLIVGSRDARVSLVLQSEGRRLRRCFKSPRICVACTDRSHHSISGELTLGYEECGIMSLLISWLPVSAWNVIIIVLSHWRARCTNHSTAGWPHSQALSWETPKSRLTATVK